MLILKSAPPKQKSNTHTLHVISLGRKELQRLCIFNWKQANVVRLPHGWWKRESMRIIRGLPTMSIAGLCPFPVGENYEITKYIHNIFEIHLQTPTSKHQFQPEMTKKKSFGEGIWLVKPSSRRDDWENSKNASSTLKDLFFQNHFAKCILK